MKLIKENYQSILVVTAGLAFLTSQTAMGFYGLSIFNKPIADSFGWSRTIAGTAGTFMFVICGIFGFLTGRLTDRYGAARVIIAGTIVSVTCYLLLSRIQEIWQFYVLYGLMGFSVSSMGIIPVSYFVSKRFNKHRGTMIGIVTMGMGAGGVLVSPLLGSWIIPQYGWRTACVVLVGVVLVMVIPSILIVLRYVPKPVHAPASMKSHVIYQNNEWTLSKAVRTPTFWMIGISMGITNMVTVALIQHQMSFLTFGGAANATAALALGALSLVSTCSKLGYGWWTSRFPARYCAFASFLAIIAAILVLLGVKGDTALFLYPVLMGVGIGGWAPTLAIITSSTYGLAAYGAIMGVFSSFVYFGSAVGPPLAGYIFDNNQSYQPVFVIMLIFAVLGAASGWLVQSPEQVLKKAGAQSKTRTPAA